MAGKLWAYRFTAAAIVWGLLLVPGLLVWQQSILFVIIMSIYANFIGSLASQHAMNSEKEEKAFREDVQRDLDDIRRLVLRNR